MSLRNQVFPSDVCSLSMKIRQGKNVPLFLCECGYGVSQYIQSALNEDCFKYYEFFLYIWFIYCYSV